MVKLGVSLSQQGVPLSQAADYQKVLDSRWRILEIAEEQIVEVTHSSWVAGWNLIKLFRHRLGFPAAFEFVDVGTVLPGNYEPTFYADTDYIYTDRFWVSGDSSAPITFKIFFRVYTINIVIDYKAPSVGALAGVKTELGGFGAKFLDQRPSRGLDEKSKHFYTLHTAARPMAIHQTGTAEPDVNNQIVVNHSLGYLPTFKLVRYEQLPADHPLPNQMVLHAFGETLGLARADSVNITLGGAQAALTGKHAYLVLKDPVELAQ